MPGRSHAYLVEGAASAIEEVTGERPRACPWWAVESPLVREVVSAHAAIVHEIARETLDTLSHRVAEGVRVYTLALARARNERDSRNRARRESSDG